MMRYAVAPAAFAAAWLGLKLFAFLTAKGGHPAEI
jgi:hypothetical protein